jgi:hypothetical protein
MSDVLSIIAIVISGCSFLFAVWKTNKIEKRQLEIEEAREKGRVAEQKSASLIAYFHLENKRRTLRIENKGKGEANNISVSLDGQPIEQHPCWIRNDHNKIKTLCGLGFGDYLLALTMDSPIPSEAEIHWDDDDKKDKVSRTTLTL